MPTRRQMIIYKRRRMALFAVLAAVIISAAVILLSKLKINTSEPDTLQAATNMTVSESETTVQTEAVPSRVYPSVPEDVKTFTNSDEISGRYAVLLDIENNRVLASRKCTEKIYPASITKIMTLIVAVEHIEDFNDTFTMTYEIIKPLVDSDATRAGFTEGENCQLSDLLYGAILPSGADATVALAEYISGSEAEFVKLMNEKVKEIGLKNTHFTNTSGLHDADHYTTALDLAVIMEYAMENDICKKILSTYKYTTHATEQHPEGIELESTMFSRMYGTEVENVNIIAGKTGYTAEAGHCLVSYADKDGKKYIAVSMDAEGRYKPIFDIFTIYRNYLPESITSAGDVTQTTASNIENN